MSHFDIHKKNTAPHIARPKQSWGWMSWFETRAGFVEKHFGAGDPEDTNTAAGIPTLSFFHKEARPVWSKLQSTSAQLHCYNYENESIMKLCADCFFLWTLSWSVSAIWRIYRLISTSGASFFFFLFAFQLQISLHYYNETTWWAKWRKCCL